MVHQNDPQWNDLIVLFPETPGSRQIFLLEVCRTQESCGTSVPLYEYKENRDRLMNTLSRMGQSGVESYWEKKNTESIDGFPTHISRLSGLNSQAK